MWIKTDPHTGGAQSLYMLPKKTDFWGNIFTLIEGTGPATTMLMKNHIQRDVTPSIPWSGQFIEHGGTNVLSNMFGAWKHVVWSYNGTSSTYSLYIDGQKVTLPTSISKDMQAILQLVEVLLANWLVLKFQNLLSEVTNSI